MRYLSFTVREVYDEMAAAVDQVVGFEGSPAGGRPKRR
jgi:hypothetical protein